MICAHCRDTHRMWLGILEREVPCTYCPLPCDACRAGGIGPYCERTPCACRCHEHDHEYRRAREARP